MTSTGPRSDCIVVCKDNGIIPGLLTLSECRMLQHVLTVPEAARRVARNPETIRRWVRSGQLPARRIGTQHVIEEADLRALVGGRALTQPAWLKRTSTGEPMPDTLGFLRRQRLSH